VISVALKTPLKTRLGIGIYKTSLPHGPMAISVLHQAVPPTFCNKIAPMVLAIGFERSKQPFFRQNRHLVICLL